jgi:hypothetical protein
MATPDNPSQPAYQLLVNGVDLTAYLEDSTWSISQNWSRQGDTAQFILNDEHPGDSVISLTFTIQPLATVVFKDTGLGQTLFSGLCTMPVQKYHGPTLTEWQMQCADWTYLADRAIVFGDFTNTNADTIVKTLTTQANCGITTNHVQPGPMIPRLQINYLTLSQAWAKVTRYASLTTTYGWFVDENQDLHFYDQVQAGAPVGLFSDQAVDFNSTNYVPGFTGAYNQDFTYLWDATSIRNSATVRGGNYSNTQTDLWLGNGTQNVWPLTYTPDQNNTAAMALTVGGVTKTVSVQTGTAASTQWAIVQNAVGGWSLTPATDPIPAAATAISFIYPYLAPVQSQVQDAASIAKFHNLPNGGRFAVYIADTTLQNITAAQGRGRREIHTYALPEERVTFNTSEVYTGHLRAGQIIKWKSQVTPDSNNSNLPGVSDTYLIVQNRISGKLTGYRSYQVTAARISTGGGP